MFAILIARALSLTRVASKVPASVEGAVNAAYPTKDSHSVWRSEGSTEGNSTVCCPELASTGITITESKPKVASKQGCRLKTTSLRY
jgi:hypothetical protein